MARDLDASCRKCRREGEKLFLKGTRCYSYKCAIERRSYPPGVHGNRRVKLSDYGLQLREKQKVKRIYGLLERQFRRYFAQAVRTKGVTGTILLQMLERRLDNVIYQLDFAASRKQGRQIVSHGLVTVNDKRVNIPSYLVNEHDEIAIKAGEKTAKFIKSNIEAAKNRVPPAWLEADPAHLKGKILRFPQREDIGMPINEQLIVELFSR